MKQEYPKYKYHRELAPIVVHSHEEHEQLGDDWKDSPAAFADLEEIPGGAVADEPAGEPVAAEKPAKAAKKGKK